LAGAIEPAPPVAWRRVVLASCVPNSGTHRPAVAFQQFEKQTRDQNVGGCGSTSPLGGANWPGKYAGRCSDVDAGKRDSPGVAGSGAERLIGAPPASVRCEPCSTDVPAVLGEAVSRGCSSITVTNPSAAIRAATFIDASKRFLLE
jgi:hypothetical protein